MTGSMARWLALAGWLALGLYGLASGLRLGVGSLASPEAGFVPALAGALLAVMAAMLALREAPARHRGAGAPMEDATGNRAAPLIAVVLLVLYAAALERAGFIASTFVLILLLARLAGSVPWWRAVALAAVSAGVGHVVFRMFLGVPLP